MKKIVLVILTGWIMSCPLSAEVNIEHVDRVELKPKRDKEKKQKSFQAKKRKKLVAKGWPGTYATKFKPKYYIESVGAKGMTLNMYDDTVWEISPSSSWTAATWQTNQSIVITPNYNWFSSYDYYLLNLATNEYVAADLSLGPKMEHAVFIKYIDPYQGYVQLKDGTTWAVGRSNRLNQWKVGQAVLRGENTSWWGREYILININENNYIPASLYNY